MLYRDYIVLCKVWHDFASQSVISRSKGNSLPLSLSFFPTFWVWKLNRGNTCIKLGRASINTKQPCLRRGDGWKREDKSTWGLALQPHLGLVYLLYRLGISQTVSLRTESELTSREESLEKNHGHQRFWLTGPLCSLFWWWTTQLEKSL